MKTNNQKVSKEATLQIAEVNKDQKHPADPGEGEKYKLTLPIDKKISHRFQALCKELYTDASKYLRRHIYDCTQAGKLI